MTRKGNFSPVNPVKKYGSQQTGQQGAGVHHAAFPDPSVPRLQRSQTEFPVFSPGRSLCDSPLCCDLPARLRTGSAPTLLLTADKGAFLSGHRIIASHKGAFSGEQISSSACFFVESGDYMPLFRVTFCFSSVASAGSGVGGEGGAPNVQSACEGRAASARDRIAVSEILTCFLHEELICVLLRI